VKQHPHGAHGSTSNQPVSRVSTLELFFDLVFVFTITQLTGLLAGEMTLVVLLRVILMLAIIFWMYGGYAWLTNAVAPNSTLRRTLILVGMGGFLAISLAIPDAFGATGWLFGLGYFVVNAVHTGLFLAAGGPGAARAMSRLGPINFGIATVVLVGGFLPLPWRYGLWILAICLLIGAPYLNPIGEFTISPSHFVERHGLLIIIALGESIVAIGVGVAGQVIDLRLVAVAVLGLSVSYLLWWVYFGGDDTEAEHALAAVEPARRARVAIEAYGWAHYVLLLGIVATAAGVKKAVGHPAGHVSLAQAIALAGGITLYLAGDVWFRRVLHIGRLRYRTVGAVVVLATIPLGLWLVSVQLIAILVLLSVMLNAEDRAHGNPWLRSRGRAGQDEVDQPAP
jgi:low temperature requirement protein LtrA